MGRLYAHPFFIAFKKIMIENKPLILYNLAINIFDTLPLLCIHTVYILITFLLPMGLLMEPKMLLA